MNGNMNLGARLSRLENGGGIDHKNSLKYAYQYFDGVQSDDIVMSDTLSPVPFNKNETKNLKVIDGKVMLEKGKTYIALATIQNSTYSHFLQLRNNNNVCLCESGSNSSYQSTTISRIYTANENDSLFITVSSGDGSAGALRRNATFSVIQLD